MRVILEVVSGPAAGKLLELAPGQALEVGRSSRAQLSLPGDRSLASLHFAVECDTDACALKAMSVDHPTLVNGTKVRLAALKDGDRIKAGENELTVRIEGGVHVPTPTATPVVAPFVTTPAVVEIKSKPRAEPIKAAPSTRLTGDRLEIYQTLRSAQPLFVVLDGAQLDEVVPLLQTATVEQCSLFDYADEDEASEFTDVAPYLIRLLPQVKLLEKLVADGWGKNWGIFLTCPLPLKQLRVHLRQLIDVEDADGDEAFFRFYDPRILRSLLPALNPAEAREFFGPITRFLVEGDSPSVVQKFTLDEHFAVESELKLLGV